MVFPFLCEWERTRGSIAAISTVAGIANATCRISWVYTPKVVRTNEIVGSVIIT